MSHFEVIEYKPKGLFITREPIFPQDFTANKPIRHSTKKSAMSCVKGLNASVEVIDAPYLPIRVFRVNRKSRTMIWKQDYEVVP